MVVTEVYGGGSVVGRFVLKKSSTTSDTSLSIEARAALEAKLTLQLGRGSAESGVDTSCLDAAAGESSSKLGMAKLEWTGGDESCHRMTFDRVEPALWRKWEESLLSKPAILTNQVSIYELLAIKE
jgi:hypothetical protein